MKRLWLKICLATFRCLDLTLEERNLCTDAILTGLEALPLRDIITSSTEGVLINGKAVDIGVLRTLRDSAIQALDNRALNFIGEQVVWLAVQNAVHKGDTPEKIHFYRAAIWFNEQLRAHLQILAGKTTESPL